MPNYLSYAEWAEMKGDGAVSTVPASLQSTGLVEGKIDEAEQDVEQAVAYAGYSVTPGSLAASAMLKGIVFRVATWLKMGHIWPDSTGGTSAAIAQNDIAGIRSGKIILPGSVVSAAGAASPIGVGVPIGGTEGARRALVLRHPLSPWGGAWPR